MASKVGFFVDDSTLVNLYDTTLYVLSQNVSCKGVCKIFTAWQMLCLMVESMQSSFHPLALFNRNIESFDPWKCVLISSSVGIDCYAPSNSDGYCWVCTYASEVLIFFFSYFFYFTLTCKGDWIRKRFETPGIITLDSEEKKTVLKRLIRSTGYDILPFFKYTKKTFLYKWTL